LREEKNRFFKQECGEVNENATMERCKKELPAIFPLFGTRIAGFSRQQFLFQE
jgi:hypothetical protein